MTVLIVNSQHNNEQRMKELALKLDLKLDSNINIDSLADTNFNTQSARMNSDIDSDIDFTEGKFENYVYIFSNDEVAKEQGKTDSQHIEIFKALHEVREEKCNEIRYEMLSEGQDRGKYEGVKLPVRVLITDEPEKMHEGYDLVLGTLAMNDEATWEYLRIFIQRAACYEEIMLTGDGGLEIYDINVSRMDEYLKFSEECLAMAGFENQTAKTMLSVIKSKDAIRELMDNLRFECMGLSEIRTDGKIAGFINAKPSGDKAVFGYYVHPDFRNMGIATKSVKMMMKYLSEIYSVSEFEAVPEKDNEAAKRVISKVGL
ncbi:MAG: GNAT family N-acetyltransferase [Lachnospiraceae bacterium]|nr:GNAT family N-acetyltransferase [Lachnospiraceae bacterium]